MGVEVAGIEGRRRDQGVGGVGRDGAEESAVAEPGWYSPVAAVYSAAESTLGGIWLQVLSLGVGTVLGTCLSSGWPGWSPLAFAGVVFLSMFTWWGWIALPLYGIAFCIMLKSDSLVVRGIVCVAVVGIAAGVAAGVTGSRGGFLFGWG